MSLQLSRLTITSSALALMLAVALAAAPAIPQAQASISVGQTTNEVVVSSSTALSGQHAAAPAPEVLIGAYPGYSFPADIDSYTSAAGSKPSLVEWFQSWDEPLYYSSQRAGIDARGVTPIITWSPGSDFTTASLLAGRYDKYLIEQAKSAKAWSRPIMIRPFHEMNGDWNSYGYGRSTPAAFVAGWRHVVNIFRAQGVTNVSWIWSPNIYGFGHTVAFDSFYPGDGYVNWVALDGYNFAGYWRSFSSLFGPAYADITTLTAKPLMVAEWGCNETDGSKANWIRDAFGQLPTKMPRIRAMVSFDHVAEDDFRINSSAASQSAYRSALSTLSRDNRRLGIVRARQVSGGRGRNVVVSVVRVHLPGISR